MVREEEEASCSSISGADVCPAPSPFTPAFSDFYPQFPSSSSLEEEVEVHGEEEEEPVSASGVDSSSPSSRTCSAASLRFLGGERKRGRKYYLAGRVGGSIFHQVLDTAADLSIIPKHIVSSLGLTEIPLSSSFQVNGFQGADSPELLVSTKCRVVTELGGASLPVEYFVAPIDVDYALLVTNLLGDPASGLRFKASSGIMEMNRRLFITKKSKIESTAELR